jgi:hypothetical protein
METSKTEPLMRCRNYKVSSKLGPISIPGLVRGEPVYCPNGDRHKGGVNMVSAFAWNVGTCHSDVKGEIQVEDPQG